MKLFAHCARRRWEIDIVREGDRLVVRCEGETLELRFDQSTRSLRSALYDSRKIDFGWTRRGASHQIVMDGAVYDVVVRDIRSEEIASLQKAAAGAAAPSEIRAPIPGLIRRVLVREGEAVRKGQPLLTLDAMKMENELCAPADGVVRQIHVHEGRTVERGQVLLSF
jgi:biotin carboxyl carrier protein